MVLVGSGLLEAALEARGTLGLVVCISGEVIAVTSRARSLLEAAASGKDVPHGIRAFALAVISLGGAQSMEVRVGSKRIKMSGIAYADAESGKKFAIVTLEEVQRPWDQIADRESWHKVLMQNWPYALYAGERREETKETIFHFANATGARLLGASSAEVVQSISAAELGWSPVELSKCWASMKVQACEGYERFTVDCESEVAPTTGARAVIRCSGVRYPDPDGSKNFRFVSAAEDVTETRASEHQLSNWKLLFENAPHGMGTGTLINNDTDVLYDTVNPPVAKMLLTMGGPKPPDGYRSSLLSNTAESAVFLRQAVECRNLGRPIDLEYFTANPHPAYWKVHYVPLGDNRFGWIAQDITKQKELELMLRKEGEQLERAVHERTRDLEEALQVKRRFLATVSHELRTPIAGILGSMELLCETAKLNDEQATLLSVARTCGEQLSTLIEDILDFTKLHEKRVELQPQEFSLRELLENVVEISSLTLLGKSIELLLEPMTEEMPDRVVLDPSRVRQIMLNLLSNSVKFTETGEIRVAVAAVPALGEGGVGRVRITVSDTGIGISAQARDKIFKPFSQADSSVSRRFGGSGLGLSISKHLAHLMGGDLTFESAAIAGQGTQFTLDVPAVVVRKCLRPAPLALGPSQRLRVVLVEGHASLRLTLEAYVRQALGGVGEVLVCESVSRAAEQLNIVSVGGKRTASALCEDEAVTSVLLTDQRRAAEAREGLSRQTHMHILYGYTRDECALGSALTTHYLKKPVRVSALRTALATALGAGAVATISTPPARAKRPEKVQRRSQLRILMAEDNLSNQLILRKYLELLGYHELTVVDNGVEAVAAATSASYDVILMDVMMPLKSGLEASEEIQRLVPAERRPFIVAVTASAFEEDRKRCLAAGMQEVLTKPVDRRKLERVLAQREAEIH